MNRIKDLFKELAGKIRALLIGFPGLLNKCLTALCKRLQGDPATGRDEDGNEGAASAAANEDDASEAVYRLLAAFNKRLQSELISDEGKDKDEDKLTLDRIMVHLIRAGMIDPDDVPKAPVQAGGETAEEKLLNAIFGSIQEDDERAAADGIAVRYMINPKKVMLMVQVHQDLRRLLDDEHIRYVIKPDTRGLYQRGLMSLDVILPCDTLHIGISASTVEHYGRIFHCADKISHLYLDSVIVWSFWFENMLIRFDR